ncbi:hypothetical protein C8J57DRAFT_1240065 [Mycena rebaudengoi]|nr:hypothetical protein C8J57DRAFT_1240065 [Mycena rebaudengoi]
MNKACNASGATGVCGTTLDMEERRERGRTWKEEEDGMGKKQGREGKGKGGHDEGGQKSCSYRSPRPSGVGITARANTIGFLSSAFGSFVSVSNVLRGKGGNEIRGKQGMSGSVAGTHPTTRLRPVKRTASAPLITSVFVGLGLLPSASSEEHQRLSAASV